ncbi:MAG: hypothetical protein P1V97_25255 [Planctomycetota bacterium]|nr:hypothetical protein [Planctomycetota bacterium]
MDVDEALKEMERGDAWYDNAFQYWTAEDFRSFTEICLHSLEEARQLYRRWEELRKNERWQEFYERGLESVLSGRARWNQTGEYVSRAELFLKDLIWLSEREAPFAWSLAKKWAKKATHMIESAEGEAWELQCFMIPFFSKVFDISVRASIPCKELVEIFLEVHPRIYKYGYDFMPDLLVRLYKRVDALESLEDVLSDNENHKSKSLREVSKVILAKIEDPGSTKES